MSRARRHDPGLGGDRHISGAEPALRPANQIKRSKLRIKGLSAPAVTGRHRPLVVFAHPEDGYISLLLLLAEANGYDVRWTSDGAEAYRLVRALEPDLLVVSPSLYLLAGEHLVTEIRSLSDLVLARTPVLVVGNGEVEDLPPQFFAAGADDYLQYPVDAPAVLLAWKRVLRYYSPPAPLTALTNPDAGIKGAALSALLAERPSGLVEGLARLLQIQDTELQGMVIGALERIGSPSAREVLSAYDAVDSDWVG